MVGLASWATSASGGCAPSREAITQAKPGRKATPSPARSTSPAPPPHASIHSGQCGTTVAPGDLVTVVGLAQRRSAAPVSGGYRSAPSSELVFEADPEAGQWLYLCDRA